jgi:cytidine deaminase
MAEFCDKDFTVLLRDGDGYTEYTLGELLPVGFGKDDLK